MEEEKIQDKKQEGILRSFVHLFEATFYSFRGLLSAFQSSIAFRQECYVFLALIIPLLFFDKAPKIWFICLFAWLLPMVVELLNSAIEDSLDLITKDFNPVIKRAKDMGSAAVFLLICFNMTLWIFLFSKDIFTLIF